MAILFFISQTPPNNQSCWLSELVRSVEVMNVIWLCILKLSIGFWRSRISLSYTKMTVGGNVRQLSKSVSRVTIEFHEDRDFCLRSVYTSFSHCRHGDAHSCLPSVWLLNVCFSALETFVVYSPLPRKWVCYQLATKLFCLCLMPDISLGIYEMNNWFIMALLELSKPTLLWLQLLVGFYNLLFIIRTWC